MTSWRKYTGVRLSDALAEFRREREDQPHSWIERFSAHGSFVQTDLGASGGRTVTSLGWRVVDLLFEAVSDDRVRLTAYADEKQQQKAAGSNAEISFELYLRDKQSPDPNATHRVSHLMVYTQPVMARAPATANTADAVRLDPRDRPVSAARQTQWNPAETSIRSIESNDDRIPAGTLLEVIVGMRRDIVWTFVRRGDGYRLAKLEFDLDRSSLAPLEAPPELSVEFVMERKGQQRVVLADDERSFETALAPGADSFHPAVHMKFRLPEAEPTDGTRFVLTLSHRGADVLRFEVDGALLDQTSKADPVRRKLRSAVVAPRNNAAAASVWDVFDGRLESVEVGFHSVEAMWLLLPRERRARDSCPRAAVFGDIRKL